MRHLSSINHIGYAVRSIEATAELYNKAGWTLSKIYEEKIQNTKIAFLTKAGFPMIELVSSLDESKSPIDIYLKSNGVCPYHICYEVANIEQALEDLYEEGFKPLFLPVESIAMDNHKICYLFHIDVGLIELVES